MSRLPREIWTPPFSLQAPDRQEPADVEQYHFFLFDKSYLPFVSVGGFNYGTSMWVFGFQEDKISEIARLTEGSIGNLFFIPEAVAPQVTGMFENREIINAGKLTWDVNGHHVSVVDYAVELEEHAEAILSNLQANPGLMRVYKRGLRALVEEAVMNNPDRASTVSLFTTDIPQWGAQMFMRELGVLDIDWFRPLTHAGKPDRLVYLATPLRSQVG